MAESNDRARPASGIIPFLTIRDGRGQEACDWYARAFGAEVIERNLAEDGKRLMQAGVTLNGALFMLSDCFEEFMPPEPPPAGTTLHLPVADVDAAYARAVEAGAEPTMPPANMFWGDRYGQLRDPFGHMWSLATPLAPPA